MRPLVVVSTQAVARTNRAGSTLATLTGKEDAAQAGRECHKIRSGTVVMTHCYLLLGAVVLAAQGELKIVLCLS